MMIANYWTPDFREFALKGNQSAQQATKYCVVAQSWISSEEVVVEKKVRQKQRHG